MFEKYQKRNSYIELLRLLFMFGILTLHMFQHGSHLDYHWIYSLGENWNTAPHLSIYSLCNVGVTGFIFISGYYGIHMSPKRFTTLLLMLIFYGTIDILLTRPFALGLLYKVIHPWDMWWFISAYLLICLLSPIINKGLEHITEKEFRYSIIGIIFYIYVGPAIPGEGMHNLELLLSIYLIARYIKLYPPQWLICNATVICLFSFMVLALAPVLVMQTTQSEKLMRIILNNNDIVLLAFAATLVMKLKHKTFHSGIINWLASSALAIYLITESSVLREPLDIKLLNLFNTTPELSYLAIVGICVSCIFIDKVRALICLPLISAVERISQRNKCLTRI